MEGAAPRFKAVAFDYFVLFDADSVVSQAEELFPGKGRQLTTLWRTRQFEYTWLRSVAHRYVDFSAVTKDALAYSANAMNLELTRDDDRRLLDAFLHLTLWPDTVGTLRTLKRSGVRVIALSNLSPAMLRANAEHAHILDLVDAFVSTDESRTYKPDPRAYQLGVDHLHLAKSAIVFAASAGWDAAGAKSFGYPTFWVNRANQPTEQLGVAPDATSPSLAGLLEFVLSRTTKQGPDSATDGSERSGRRSGCLRAIVTHRLSTDKSSQACRRRWSKGCGRPVSSSGDLPTTTNPSAS